MRLLIDGYNVMYAAGRLGPRPKGPEGFRQARQRFLNELAAILEPIEAAATTVVFDAKEPPANRPSTHPHKGMTVVFATSEDDADSEIERLIARHSAPRSLRVVSSDLRIREAARRRKARPVTADVFLDELDQRKRRKASLAARPAPTPTEAERPRGGESAHWLREFAELADDPALEEITRPEPFLPGEDDVARIAREVAREITPDRGRLPRTGKR